MLAPARMTAADDSSGRWAMYPTLSYNIDKAVEGDNRLYAVSNGKLFSRDIETEEVYIYSTANKLSDTTIADIYYNSDGKYLLICYTNGNIDLLYDDGRVVNLPEIKDAVISAGHGINDVLFADGRIYLATDFGLAVYDEKKQEIVDSGIYNLKATSVMRMADKLLLQIGTSVYVSDKDARHYSFDSFTELPAVWTTKAKAVSDNVIALVHSSGLVRYEVNPETFIETSRTNYGFTPKDNILVPLADGTLFSRTDDKIYIVDADGIKESLTIPAALNDATIFSNRGLASVWAADIDGIGRYNLSGETPTVLMIPSRPEALTVNRALGFTLSPDGNRLYIVPVTPSQFLLGDDVDNWNGIQTVNIFEPATGAIRDVTVKQFDPTGISADMASRQKQTGWKGLVGGPSRVAEDPDDPDIWYQAFNGGPFFAFRNNEPLAWFTNKNCFDGGSAARGYNIAIDPAGNLWLGLGHREAPDPTYMVLPAEKRRGDLSAVTKSDFIQLSYPGFSGSRELDALFCRHSNHIFLTVGSWSNAIVAIDTKGTPSDFSDDTHVVHHAFTDTEGHSLDILRLPFPVEDHNGQIWFCSDIGPLVLTRPSTALTSDMTLRRPIVPRNDGTQFGDYLLDGVKVLSIAVDPSNRKWIATETDGVYLVNEDGTDIIRHFNKTNSPLSSNTVYAVACHPHSNKVMFGASDGLYVFDSDSSPAADDYSDVYAYPNPVRPEYTGWITIAGLKDNSLVKIADIAGNVFFQGRSEGGMISWDGCNSAGERVRTGVYFVFASENADGGSSGAVAKIMVVN